MLEQLILPHLLFNTVLLLRLYLHITGLELLQQVNRLRFLSTPTITVLDHSPLMHRSYLLTVPQVMKTAPIMPKR